MKTYYLRVDGDENRYYEEIFDFSNCSCEKLGLGKLSSNTREFISISDIFEFIEHHTARLFVISTTKPEYIELDYMILNLDKLEIMEYTSPTGSIKFLSYLDLLYDSYVDKVSKHFSFEYKTLKKFKKI